MAQAPRRPRSQGANHVHVFPHRSAAVAPLPLPVLVGVAAIAPAATSTAATATFSASFEAERSAQWNIPRSVGLTDCNGDHYSGSHGEDHTSMKTRRPFKVVVRSVGGALFWQFGSLPRPNDPLSYGIEAHGVSTRGYFRLSGTTGGWCGAGQTDPPPKTDCGTRLPDYQVAFSAGRRELTWSASFASRPNERFDFYNCPLNVPGGMNISSFPSLAAKYNGSTLFARRSRPLVIGVSKNYGPDTRPAGFTASRHASWKLTLTRIK
jgi:hypothetical protein